MELVAVGFYDNDGTAFFMAESGRQTNIPELNSGVSSYFARLSRYNRVYAEISIDRETAHYLANILEQENIDMGIICH